MFRGLLVLVALLALAAGGQERRTVSFRTVPARVEVHDTLVPGNTFLGMSDQPITVPAGRPRLSLDFRREGYEKQTRTVLITDLTGGTYPPKTAGPVTLAPQSAGAMLERYGVLLALPLCCVPVPFLLVQLRRRKSREAQIAVYQRRSAELGDPAIGKSIEGYVLTDRLGQGGMATVYRGEKPGEDPVAIKILKTELQGPDFDVRFQREVNSLAQLSHPAILRLIRYGHEDGAAYLILELVEGGTMRERIPDEGLPPKQAWEMLLPIFDAMDFAHSLGVVHRDLKPENVMMTSQGRPKVSDFGLAKRVDASKYTGSGDTLGTPRYMAPEQIMSNPPAPTMDQYALGVMTWELLKGHAPFDAPDPVQLIFMHLQQDPEPPGISPAVDAVVLRMLDKDPKARFPSVGQAGAALREAIT